MIWQFNGRQKWKQRHLQDVRINSQQGHEGESKKRKAKLEPFNSSNTDYSDSDEDEIERRSSKSSMSVMLRSNNHDTDEENHVLEVTCYNCKRSAVNVHYFEFNGKEDYLCLKFCI